jgi:phosphoglycerol transferase MdoB-like AlkP superfamily enzyme
MHAASPLPVEAPAAAPRAAGLRRNLPWFAFVAALAAKQLGLVAAMGLQFGPWLAVLAGVSAVALAAGIRALPGRAQVLAALGLDLVVSTIFLADLLYFREFTDLTSAATLRYADQLGSVSASVTALLRPADALLFADLPLLAALLGAPATLRERLLERWSWRRATTVGGAAAAFVALIALTDPTRTYQHRGHTHLAKRLGPVAYHVIDGGGYLAKRYLVPAPTAAELDRLRRRLAAGAAATPGPLAGAAKGRNLIVVQVESLMDFVVGLRVGGVEVTPNLNRLAGESLRFRDFWEETGQGKTADADLLGNCSLYPLRTGAVYYEYGDDDYRCLPRVLGDAGYDTAALQGIRGEFWNLYAVYPRLGFARYHSLRDFADDERIGLGLSDATFLRQAPEKLAALAEPFHAFVVTMSSHDPYDYEGIPSGTLPLGELAGQKLGHYFEALHYTDAALGRFVDDLRARGLLDRSLLAIYGDHGGLGIVRGPALGGLLGIDPADAVAWARVERKVPLLVRFPGGAHAGVTDTPGGELDLAPTLAGLLGVAPRGAPFFGRDLLAAEGPAPLVALPDGTATDGARLYLAPDARGETDHPAGRCFDAVAGTPIDRAACDALAARAEADLEASRDLVRRNLLGKLGGTAPRVAGAAE